MTEYDMMMMWLLELSISYLPSDRSIVNIGIHNDTKLIIIIEGCIIQIIKFSYSWIELASLSLKLQHMVPPLFNKMSLSLLKLDSFWITW